MILNVSPTHLQGVVCSYCVESLKFRYFAKKANLCAKYHYTNSHICSAVSLILWIILIKKSLNIKYFTSLHCTEARNGNEKTFRVKINV